jgi:hypothetical protein
MDHYLNNIPLFFFEDEHPFASYLGFTWAPGFLPIGMCLRITIHARDGLDEACWQNLMHMKFIDHLGFVDVHYFLFFGCNCAAPRLLNLVYNIYNPT